MLPNRQAETFRIIKEYHAKQGFWPSLSEIGQELGVRSDNAVLKHLDALEKKGYIQRARNENGNRLVRMITILR